MRIFNKTVNREFSILEKYEAGIALTGAEVKSIKAGRLNFAGSFVKIMTDGEVYLINADIPAYEFSRPEGYDSRRTRKLLLHKAEIIRLQTKILSSPSLTIVPIVCYTKKSKIKLEIGLAKGKKEWEKKSVEKRQDEQRRVEKEMKEYIKK